MRWHISHQADWRACALANRHYSRKTIGAPQFTPPGRKLVLATPTYDALWVTSWPFPEFVNRIYPDAWLCSLFRNEGPCLSSLLIRDALAATVWRFGEPPREGMVTMVDTRKVRSSNPGCCFKKAGFRTVGRTKGGLVILQVTACDMPEPEAPLGAQLRLFA